MGGVSLRVVCKQNGGATSFRGCIILFLCRHDFYTYHVIFFRLNIVIRFFFCWR